MISIALSVLIGLASTVTCTVEEAPKKIQLPAWLRNLNKHVSSASIEERFLASVGLSVGTAASMLGALGAAGEQNVSFLKELGLEGSYLYLMIPGMFLAWYSGRFLFKSAKGWYSKLNSLLSAASLFGGAGCFVIGLDDVVNRRGDDVMLLGACAVLLTACGISDNLHTDPESQEVDAE